MKTATFDDPTGVTTEPWDIPPRLLLTVLTQMTTAIIKMATAARIPTSIPAIAPLDLK